MGLPYLEGVAIIKATSNMATFRVRKRKEGRGDMPSREGDMPSREGDMPSREGDTPPLGREKEQPQMVSAGTPLKREETLDGSVKSADVGSPLASGENVATTTQQPTPSPEEYTSTQQEATPTQQKATPTQQEATPSPKDELTTPPQMIPPTDDLHVEEKIGKCMWGCMLSNIHVPHVWGCM